MNRTKGIGGSDAAKIMDGDWHDLWLIKTARKQSDDLSAVLPVQIGIVTEDLNRQWFQRETGLLVSTDNCDDLKGAAHPFMTANLDGRVTDNMGAELGVFEAKHVNAFAKAENVIERYYPQCQHYMAVTGLPVSYLSIFIGTLKWESFEIDSDAEYQALLIEREREFWQHVIDDDEPANQASQAPEISMDEMREVDLTGSNEWADKAAVWLENKEPANKFNKAVKEIKTLVEPDVKKAFGHGITANRAKNGAISIRAM